MCAIMEDLRNESLAEGQAIGEAIGTIKILADMIREGRYTLQEAAAKVNMTEEDFIREAKELGK